MNSTKFFPSTIYQVILYLLISFIWIFFVVQFDLKYMNHYNLDKRMAIEGFLMLIGPIILCYFINIYKNSFPKIVLKKLDFKLLINAGIISAILVVFVYLIKTKFHTQNFSFNPYHNNIWMLVSIGLIGPILEEFIFRGIILQGLKQTLNIRWAIIISSTLFMLIHEPSQYLLAISTGLIFGFTYSKSNNILTPIILHILTNNFSTLLAYILYLYFQ